MEDFKKQFRGYNKVQVDEALYASKRKTKKLEDSISKMEAELEKLRERNALLEQRIDVTEKTNEEIARLALKEASELIDKAKRNANMILKESLEYVRNLSGEMSEFKEQAIQFRTSVQKMSKDIIDTIDKSEVYNLLIEEEEE